MITTEGMVCPRCGRGTLSRQTVDEVVAVGGNAAQVTVDADVCSFCDEHWLSPDAAAVIDEMIRKLRSGDFSNLTAIGELYRAS